MSTPQSAEAVNVRIHELLGNKTEPCTCANGLVKRDVKTKQHLPNYSGSLDAMAEAEKTLTPEERRIYGDKVLAILCANKRSRNESAWCDSFDYLHANATQRAAAFLTTKTRTNL